MKAHGGQLELLLGAAGRGGRERENHRLRRRERHLNSMIEVEGKRKICNYGERWEGERETNFLSPHILAIFLPLLIPLPPSRSRLFQRLLHFYVFLNFHWPVEIQIDVASSWLFDATSHQPLQNAENQLTPWNRVVPMDLPTLLTRQKNKREIYKILYLLIK